MKRRDFLSASLVTLTAATLPPATVMALTSGSPAAPRLTRKWFDTLLNSRFRMLDGPFSGRELELVAIADGPRSPGLEQFAAVFRGSTANALQPGLYNLHHSGQGRVQLYLEPAAGHTTGSLYRAPFSLLV